LVFYYDFMLLHNLKHHHSTLGTQMLLLELRTVFLHLKEPNNNLWCYHFIYVF
jgi:hypothetical protein